MIRPYVSLIAGVLALCSLGATASGGSTVFHYDADVGNTASLQRGARNYMNYCAGCHSMKHLRYSRIGQDLGIPDDLLQANLMFTSDKIGDPIKASIASADALKWFGRVPPDLTLSTRLRGESWVYSYLMTFYLDPSKPSGVNNLMLPGLSMPNVLGDLQGWQVLHKADGEDAHGGHAKPKLELVKPGSMSPQEYKDFVSDLVNFMAYAAEPGRSERVALGWKVMLYLLVLLVVTYLLKKEYWKDVH